MIMQALVWILKFTFSFSLKCTSYWSSKEIFKFEENRCITRAFNLSQAPLKIGYLDLHKTALEHIYQNTIASVSYPRIRDHFIVFSLLKNGQTLICSYRLARNKQI